jgi:integrase/recombinase XerC
MLLAQFEETSRGLALPGSVRFSLVDALVSDKAASTADAYRKDLATFAEFTGHEDAETAAQSFVLLGNGSANALLLAWKAAMLSEGKASATINRRLAAVKALVKRARMIGLTTLCVDVPGERRTAYRDTRGPGAAAVGAMLVELAKRSDAKGTRDQAVLSLLSDLGLRRGEVVGLDLEHVDITGSRLAVLGKGRRDREWVTMPEPTAAALARWLEIRGEEPGPLFGNFDRAHKGTGRLTGAAVYNLVRKVSSRVGSRTRPHGLRHSAVTSALDATNGDVRAVRLYSRHSDIGIVCVYDDRRVDLGGSVARLVAGKIRHEMAAHLAAV